MHTPEQIAAEQDTVEAELSRLEALYEPLAGWVGVFDREDDWGDLTAELHGIIVGDDLDNPLAPTGYERFSDAMDAASAMTVRGLFAELLPKFTDQPPVERAEPQQLRLDRPHRFRVGQRIRHIDSSDILDVEALTLRVRDGVAYPTYTLAGFAPLYEIVVDVLCTDDLVEVGA